MFIPNAYFLKDCFQLFVGFVSLFLCFFELYDCIFDVQGIVFGILDCQVTAFICPDFPREFPLIQLGKSSWYFQGFLAYNKHWTASSNVSMRPWHRNGRSMTRSSRKSTLTGFPKKHLAGISICAATERYRTQGSGWVWNEHSVGSADCRM